MSVGGCCEVGLGCGVAFSGDGDGVGGDLNSHQIAPRVNRRSAAKNPSLNLLTSVTSLKDHLVIMVFITHSMRFVITWWQAMIGAGGT